MSSPEPLCGVLTGRVLRAWVTILSLGLLLLLAPAARTPRVLYVDASAGDDARTYAENSPTRPWATIGRAAWGSTRREVPNPDEAAQQGDTVLVRAGTYETAGTGDRWAVAYNPANSGTENAPIVFQGEGLVVLTLNSGRGPLIGSNRRDHVTWRNFTIHEENAPRTPDTGSVVVWGATGVVLERLVLDGNGSPGDGDNHPGIRLEYAVNTVVRDSRISNYHINANPGNGVGIQVYFSGPLLFEHNEIFNCGAGIALKAPFDKHVDAITVRHNLIYDVQDGIIVHRSPARPDAPSRIYQNVIRDTIQAGVRLLGFDQPTGPRNAKIVNNTFFRVGYALAINGGPLVDDAGHVFWNNVISTTHHAAVYTEIATAPNITPKSRFSSEHNVFHDVGVFANVQDSGRLSLADWRRVLGHDELPPLTTTADPRFVDASDGDFRLQAHSPARVLGVDVLDLNDDGSVTDLIPAGAFITGDETVGPTTSVRQIDGSPPR